MRRVPPLILNVPLGNRTVEVALEKGGGGGGGGGGLTVTVAFAVGEVPPAPVQAIE